MTSLDSLQKRMDQIERRLDKLEEAARATMALGTEIRMLVKRLGDKRDERLDRIETELAGLRQGLPGIPAETLRGLQRRQWATRR